MVSVRGWVIRATERAYLFVAAAQMGKAFWLPKSQVKVNENEWDDTLTLPDWLAAQNGIRGLPRAPRGHGR